jgi:two-component system OmpR family sensor kinase
MSLRLRSILAAALVTMLALVALAFAVDVLVARHLHRELDHSLRLRAVEVAQLAASAPALLSAPGSLDSEIGATQSMVEVVDRHDRIVGRSLSMGGRVLPAGIARAAIVGAKGRFRTIDFGGETVRLYAAPIADVGGPASHGAVVVAAPMSEVGDTIATLHEFTLLAALAVAVAGALGTTLLMRGTLQPLARLDRAAAEIGRTADASRRLPGPFRPDEVGRLALTLNAMLDSLEQAREGERRFVADASHELRTPLTALRGNVDHLARHGATAALIADLQVDVERLARLADDLLALSREEATEAPVAEVRLEEVARAVAASDVAVTAEAVTVAGDRDALERALANLIENARRYGPEGGQIAVTASAAAGRALITVTDEGVGPAVGDREHVFERFWRGESDGNGSGLGLAIVRATAARHGGSAYVDGPVFTIDLPAFRKASESIATPSGEDLPKGSP